MSTKLATLNLRFSLKEGINMKLFKIVAIVDTSTVIINGGSKDGINLKSKFDILEDHPVQIKDPDSDEVLGEFKQKKQRIYAKEVHERYTICTSKYTITESAHNLVDGIFNLNGSVYGDRFSSNQVKKTIGKDMKIDKNEADNVLSPYSYNMVHKHDTVQLVKD